MSTDQRNERRYVVRQKAQIIRADGTGIPILLAELSPNGACILAPAPANLGAQYTIRAPLFVTGKAYHIEFTAVVRYSILEGATGKHRIGMAIKDFAGDSKAVLVELLKMLPHL